jgi:hypothetical protein
MQDAGEVGGGANKQSDAFNGGGGDHTVESALKLNILVNLKLF